MVNATMGAPLTRAEALQWCVDKLTAWPAFGVQLLPAAPAGWQWVLSASQNWYLKNTEKHGDAILEPHYRDACYLRDQNNIGKAVDATICGVPARVGDRVKVKKGSSGYTVGILGGVMNNNIWLTDCTPGPENQIAEINHITGFAPITERDDFVDRAMKTRRLLPPLPEPSTPDDSCRQFLSALYDAGARFTDQGEE